MHSKSILFSGIQPTNKLTLGNYLGAIKAVEVNQDKYQTILFVADLHARTLPLTYYHYSYRDLERYSLNVVKMYVALGIDLEKTMVFFQSKVSQHLELFYFLLAHSCLGELKRMTQYKFLLGKLKEPNQTEASLMGILIYPVLMAADILLYQAEYISVGKDQEQHLELCADIALRINEKYGKQLFKLPKKLNFNDENCASKIMDLQDCTKKMSKTCDNPNGVIFLTDTPKEAMEKIMKAKTDSVGVLNLDKEKQGGIYNLLVIYAGLTNTKLVDAFEKFKNYTYFEFKKAVGEEVGRFLGNLQAKYASIDEKDLINKLEAYSKQAEEMGKKTLENIYSNI